MSAVKKSGKKIREKRIKTEVESTRRKVISQLQ